MIDKQGLRLNVGIILCNKEKQLFWGRRPGLSEAWQFPQGGIHEKETVEAAMFRELEEELGLSATHVTILGVTQDWHTYYLPPQFRSRKSTCIGQKQKWYLLQLIASPKYIRFDRCHPPEFVSWRWVDYWYPVEQIIDFKRDVYTKVLTEFEPLIP